MTPDERIQIARLVLRWKELSEQMNTAVARGNWLALGRLVVDVAELAAGGVLANLLIATRPGALDANADPVLPASELRDSLRIGPVTIHVLHLRRPLCGFSLEPPGRWPIGHIWIRREQYAANDPEHELHAILRYQMCKGCEAVIESEPAPPPLPPVPGRTCLRCGVELKPEHVPVYCSNECALADGAISRRHRSNARSSQPGGGSTIPPYGNGAKLTPDEIAIVLHDAGGYRCPDCLSVLVEGPHGGLSTNWYCPDPDCGSRFNFCGPRAELGIERISEARPAARNASSIAEALLQALDPEPGEDEHAPVGTHVLAVHAGKHGEISLAFSESRRPLPPACSARAIEALDRLFAACREEAQRQMNEFGVAAGYQRAPSDRGDA